MTKQEKYIKFVSNDIIKRLEFNDPIFFHIAEFAGERINTCNLYASLPDTISDTYGARVGESHRIIEIVIKRLNEIYPDRCIPN
jgi:hypothetical protein